MGKKTEENKNYIYGALVLAIVPWLAVFLYSLLVKADIFSLYLPASEWNDELLYYSMTQNITQFGMSKGYMGFNEMHSQFFSFAAWSPVILLQWVIWGLLFGWNMMSPYLSNLFMMSACLAAFCLLAKPKLKSVFVMAFCLIAFIPLSRFSLSCVPETELWGLSILFFGIAVRACRNFPGNGKKIGASCFVWMYILVALLTWMRPYLLVFAIIPLVFGVVNSKKKKKKTVYPVIVFAGCIAVIVAGYVLISKYFCSPYTEDLFYLDWIRTFASGGFSAGVRFLGDKLYISIKTVYGLILSCFRKEAYYASGLYYLIFLAFCGVMGILFVVRFFRTIFRKEGKGLWLFLEFSLLISMAAFFVADMLMYRIQEGGRHTLVYIVAAFVLMPVIYSESMPKNGNLPGLLSGIFVLAVFLGLGNIPYEFSLPAKESYIYNEIENLEPVLDEKMVLSSGGPTYDNTVIWTDDSPFGYYYAVNPGVGINFCTTAFLSENMDNLKSRYIGVKKDSDKDEWCRERGYEEIWSNHEIVFYARY